MNAPQSAGLRALAVIFIISLGFLPSLAQKPEAEETPTPTPTAASTATPEPELSPSPAAKKTPKAAAIYISDSGNSRVVRISDMDGTGFSYFGYPGKGLGRLLNPGQVWVDPLGRILIADTGNDRIMRMDDFTGKGYVEMGGFKAPEGIASKGDEVYVADTGNNQVLVYSDLNGDLKRTYKDHRLDHPIALWLDEDATLYVICGQDPPGGRVVKLVEPEDPEGKKWEVYSGQNLSSSGFGPAMAMTFKGDLFVVDSASHRIVRVTGFKGTGAREIGGFGRAPNRYKNPSGGGLDQTGRVYVADTGNDRIVRVDGISGQGWTEYLGPGKTEKNQIELREPRSVFVWSPAPAPSPSPSPSKDKGKDKAKEG
jgi:DNA-binding beta-propeller fold protein YncE